MTLVLFPTALKAGAGAIPKSTSFLTGLKSFFSGTSGSVAKSTLKVGGAVGGGSLLASIGLGSLGNTIGGFDTATGFAGSGLLIILAIIAVVIIFLVKR